MMIEGWVRCLANTTGARTKRFFTHWWGRIARIIPRTRQSSVPFGESGNRGGCAIKPPEGGPLSGGPELGAPALRGGEDGGLPAGTELTDAGEPPCSAGAGAS